jgi:hypothetical protein
MILSSDQGELHTANCQLSWPPWHYAALASTARPHRPGVLPGGCSFRDGNTGLPGTGHQGMCATWGKCARILLQDCFSRGTHSSTAPRSSPSPSPHAPEDRRKRHSGGGPPERGNDLLPTTHCPLSTSSVIPLWLDMHISAVYFSQGYQAVDNLI